MNVAVYHGYHGDRILLSYLKQNFSLFAQLQKAS